MTRRIWFFSLPALLGLVFCGQATAALVTGWGLDTGLANATLTEGAAGAFSITVPTGNAGPRALFPALTLASVNDSIKVTGTVTTSNSMGNQQFRVGLYNPNGHAVGTLGGGVWTGADTAGWLGYMFSAGGAAGADSIRGRNGTGTNAWLSNTDSYIAGQTTTTDTAAAATPYAFSLTLTRIATGVQTDFTFAGGTINRSGSYIDAAGLSAPNTTYTAVGFLFNANTGSGVLSNVNVTKSVVPEPTAGVLLGTLFASAALIRRRIV